jgi:hypothetical protein
MGGVIRSGRLRVLGGFMGEFLLSVFNIDFGGRFEGFLDGGGFQVNVVSE